MTHEERRCLLASRSCRLSWSKRCCIPAFLGRQHCAFARIVRGQKMVDFLEKLTSRKLANTPTSADSKARVYHLHNTSLYDAIEQARRFRSAWRSAGRSSG